MPTREQYTSLEDFLVALPDLAAKAGPALKGQNGRFLLKTTEGSAWAVLLSDGIFSVAAPTPEDLPYDCTATVDDTVLLNIINGKANAVKALLTRKIRAEGNVTKLLPLLKML